MSDQKQLDEEPDIRRLQADIEDIKKQREQENKGFLGWTKRSAGILAFIAAIFAVPHGGIQFYNSLRQLLSHADTSLTSSEIGWVYHPDKKLLELHFPLTVINKGNEDDILIDATARLDTATKTPNFVEDFNHNDFKCSEKDPPDPLPKLLRVAAKTQLPLRCSLASVLTEQSSGMFQNAGLLRLTIDFHAENKEIRSIEFCFNPTGKTTGKFVDPLCFEGEG